MVKILPKKQLKPSLQDSATNITSVVGKSSTAVDKIRNQRKQRKKSGIRQTSKIALFLQLAKPDEKGISRWVNSDEWIGEYAILALGNGLSWGRKGSKLDEMYIIEVDRSKTTGNSIDAIRTNGYKDPVALATLVTVTLPQVTTVTTVPSPITPPTIVTV
jgi:hypothetical protein